jgi:hypothetical protein
MRILLNKMREGSGSIKLAQDNSNDCTYTLLVVVKLCELVCLRGADEEVAATVAHCTPAHPLGVLRPLHAQHILSKHILY